MCFIASKLTLFFRSDKYSSANHAFSILEGLFFADAVVPEIGIPDPEGILSPVVTECFQVPVVETWSKENDDIEPLSRNKFLFAYSLKSGNYGQKESGQTDFSTNLSAFAPQAGLEPATL